MSVLDEMFGSLKTKITVDTESSDERNKAMGIVVTATNQLIKLEGVVAQVAGTLTGGIQDAKAAGMTADEVRHVIREKLSISNDEMPQCVLTRISEAYRVVPTDETKSVAENIVAQVTSTPSNSRPSTIDSVEMGKLVEYVMNKENFPKVGGDPKKVITFLRGTARNLKIAQDAAK